MTTSKHGVSREAAARASRKSQQVPHALAVDGDADGGPPIEEVTIHDPTCTRKLRAWIEKRPDIRGNRQQNVLPARHRHRCAYRVTAVTPSNWQWPRAHPSWRAGTGRQSRHGVSCVGPLVSSFHRFAASDKSPQSGELWRCSWRSAGGSVPAPQVSRGFPTRPDGERPGNFAASFYFTTLHAHVHNLARSRRRQRGQNRGDEWH